MFISFYNIIDSVNAAGELPKQYPSWVIEFIKAKEFAEGRQIGSGVNHSNHKGQLLVTLTQLAHNSDVGSTEAMRHVGQMMKGCGDVLAWDIRYQHFPRITIIMEFFDLRVADQARTTLNGIILGVSFI